VTKSSAARRRPPVNVSRKKVVRYSSEVEFVTVSVELKYFVFHLIYNNNNNNPICKAPECQKTSVVLKLCETVSQLNVGFIFMVVLVFQLADHADGRLIKPQESWGLMI